jgi:hypothetical protein
MQETPESIERNLPGTGRRLVFFLNSDIDFVPMYLDRRRRFDSQSNLPATNAKHNDTNGWTDRDAFSTPTRKNQH